MRPALVYTVARLAVFAVVAALLYLVGLRGITLLLVALVASGIVALFALGRQRDALSEQVTRAKQAVDERASAEDAADDARRAEQDQRANPPAEPEQDRPE